jgi:hypothetical protein
MAAKLGSDDVSFRLGAGEVAAVYLGSQEVWSAASVPGALASAQASEVNCETTGCETVISWLAPESDGGSDIIGYRVYSLGDDSLIAEVGPSVFEVVLPGQYCVSGGVEVSAVNAIGEGPRTAASPCNVY